LLLLDIHMPPGNPHGPAFARMAKVRCPKLRIMYVTGYPDLAGIEELLGKVLVKPVELNFLADEIKAQLELAG